MQVILETRCCTNSYEQTEAVEYFTLTCLLYAKVSFAGFSLCFPDWVPGKSMIKKCYQPELRLLREKKTVDHGCTPGKLLPFTET